jgi:uncharacterized protein YggT (Ycf19 family)
MSDIRHDRGSPANGDDDLKRQTISQERSPLNTGIQMAVRYTVAVIATLLSFRFLFALLNADSKNGFVSFIYAMTEPFVTPFQGMFSSSASAGAADFEIETLVAILIYILIGAAVVNLLDILDKSGYANRH